MKMREAITVRILLYTLFVGIFFGLLTQKIIFSTNLATEYPNHINKAEEMSRQKKILLPHFLFHIATIGHQKILKFDGREDNSTSPQLRINHDWGVAGLVVMVEVYVSIALILFFYLRTAFVNSGVARPEFLAFLVAFSLSIVTPIFLLAPIDGKFYLGYLSPSIYIIPTQVLLKLFSLALFLLTPSFFIRGKGIVSPILLALLVVLCGLAKPNYLIVMLPALTFLIVLQLMGKSYINWKLILVAYFSSLAVLSWQYYFKFADPASPIYQSSITLTTPFEVWSYYSDYIALKFVLSSLFPLYVAIIFWRSIASDVLSKYAWILYIIGLAYTGFLAESAANPAIKYAGNFIWSGQIANFLLFVSAAKLFFSTTSFCPWRVNKKMLFGLLLFMLHTAAGLMYYIRSFSFNYT